MKKNLILLTLFSLGVFGTLQAQLSVGGTTYLIDTLADYQVGPGSFYTQLKLQEGSKRIDVYFLKVKVNTPYLSFESVLGNDYILTGERPSAMAQRKSNDQVTYFAGTNGDFYVTVGDVGLPTAAAMVGKELAYTPNNSRKVVSVDSDNTPRLGTMVYSGTVTRGVDTRAINHVNYNRNADELTLYNRHQGSTTRTNAFGSEALIRLADGENWGVNKTVKCVVEKIESNVGAMAIPAGKAVLSGHGVAQTWVEGLAVDDTVSINLTMTVSGITADYTTVVGGEARALMLNNGVVEQSDVWAELHPRTGFGHSKSRDTVIFCVVDGRGKSRGCTTLELAELMQSAGAYTALNLDGGGSSCMYIKEFGPVNATSDGPERAVSNGLFAVSTAPQSADIASIQCYTKTIALPRYGVFKPKILGYNEYDVLIDTDVQGCELSCLPEMGHIDDEGNYVASGTQGGQLTVTYNETIQTTVNIIFVASAEVFLRLDSVLIDNDFEYSIEVQSVIGNNTLTVLPAALTWTVEDQTVCKVTDGVLQGLSTGSTLVIGTLGDFSDTLLVNVEIPAEPRMVFDDFSTAATDWTLSSSLASWNTHFENDDAGTHINFHYSTVRGAFIKMLRIARLYSLPDSIQVIVNSNEAKLLKVLINLQPNDNRRNISTIFPDIAKNRDVALTIVPDNIVTNPGDIRIYPVWMNDITFNFDDSQMTSNSDYTIDIKELILYYGNVSLATPSTKLAGQLIVYPNPTSGEAFVSLKVGATDLVRVEVIGINGQTLRNVAPKMRDGIVTLPTQGLDAGVYFVRIFINNHSQTVKLIIQ
jgi:hypothetical protein